MRQLTRRGFTAAGIIFAASFASGCFDAKDNMPATVYGPPEADREEPNAYDPSKNEVQVVYGPPPGDYDVWGNVPEDVYGPPPEGDSWT